MRSPKEYAQGCLPGALNLPLLDDQQRALVGTCYKQQGRAAAVELGFDLVGPAFGDLLRRSWAIAPTNPLRLYCWRGGLRSNTMAWILGTAGREVAVLAGGYKAYRHWCLATLSSPRPIILLGGMTGTGKTAILHALAAQGAQVLDLEGLASHRGSSFGGVGLPPQPTTEAFENAIADQWQQFRPDQPVWVEAESRQIGYCRLPQALFDQMAQAPAIHIERARPERVDRLVADYGDAATADLIAATERLHKRLGGLRTQQVTTLLRARQLAPAFDLLLDYYDKTYRYGLAQMPPPLATLEVTGLAIATAAQKLQALAQSALEQSFQLATDSV